MAIQRRARGVRIPTPGGHVIGRLRGEGAAYPIAIEDLARQVASTGVVGGGGSAPGSFTAGSGISITGTWPSLTFSNTGVLSAIAGTGIGVSGATGNVTFSNTGVTSNVAGSGIAVSGATGTSTISLAAIADLRIMANISGGAAVPSANTMTAIMDATLGSTQGNIAYRNGTVWTVLAPAANVDTRQAQIKALIQEGSGQSPRWNSVGHFAWKRPMTAATTAALPACTYNNGTVGVGATLTGNSNGALPAQDGVTLDVSVANTLLVKDQATQTQNGAYWVTQLGSAGTPFILTRMEDANDYTSFSQSHLFPVDQGTVNGSSIWKANVAAPNTTFGSDNITFIRVGGVLTAGTGISVSGSTVTNTGVTSIVAGTNVTVSGATGAVTVNAPNAGAGNYLGRRVLSGSGTYTPTTGTASIVLKMVGGGGAGGGVPVTSSVQQSEGSGGGAGAVIETYLTSGFSGVSYGVGAAGAAASGAVGGNGGDTTFDTRTAGGGTGGGVGILTNIGVAGSLGGVVAGNVAGDIAFAGMRGWYSSPVLNGGDAVSGRGADAPLGYGFGGSETLASAAGVSATGYGSGGGGAANGASQSARSGGTGGAGIIIIDEYGPSAATSGVLSGLTTGKVPRATSASALGDSEIKNTGGTGGVEVGSPTSGQKGNGTLNAQGLYVNGTAVLTSGGGSSGGGLFSGVLTPPPTIAGGTWTAIGTPAGLDGTGCITVLGTNPAGLNGYQINVPSTPFTRTGFFTDIGGTVASGVLYGVYFSDGTKIQIFYFASNAGGSGSNGIIVDNYTNRTTFSGNASAALALQNTSLIWFQISDDGTNFAYKWGSDGVNWITKFSGTKTGSFLGTSGFTKVGFVMQGPNNASSTSLWSWV